MRAACATAAAMWAVSASAQSLDVERKGTIPDVRVERSGLNISDGRPPTWTMQVDYLYRASTSVKPARARRWGSRSVNCGLRVRDIRGSVSLPLIAGRAVKVEDQTLQTKISSRSFPPPFVMDFEGRLPSTATPGCAAEKA